MTSKTTSKTSKTSTTSKTVIQGSGKLVRRWNQPQHGMVTVTPTDLRVDQMVKNSESGLVARLVIKLVDKAWRSLRDGANQGVAESMIAKVVLNKINQEDYLVTIDLYKEASDFVDTSIIWRYIDREEEEFGDVLLSRIGSKATYIHRM